MPILEIPWEESRYLRSKYPQVLTTYRDGLHLYKGSVLPAELRPYATQDFSYARWLEDDALIASGKPCTPPQRPKKVFTPHPHQKDAARAFYKAYTAGWSGLLLSDGTGTGKSLSSVLGLTLLATKSGFDRNKKAKVLIVCPKSVIPQWRQTFRNFPKSTEVCRPLIINYQQLGKLLESKEAGKAKTTRGKNRAKARSGKPLIDFDFVVFDESQYLKNYPSSTVSLNAVKVAKLDKPYSILSTPFVIFSTATPGATPLNLSVMSGFLSRLLSPALKVGVTPAQWGDFLQRQGFAVSKGKTGYTWATVPWFGKNSDDPKERKKYEMAVKKAKQVQRADTIKIGKALLRPDAPFLKRSPVDIAGWPEQQLVALPVDLSVTERRLYEEAWTRFRKFLKLPGNQQDPKSALVENLRYRQKTALLKVPAMVDFVKDQLDADKQVYVSTEFLEVVEEYAKLLEKSGARVARFTGQNVADRENERLRFQKGDAKVILSTVVEGVSFHAGETLPDGSTATMAERVSIIHSIRQNPENAQQSLGRAHRDGQNSVAYFPVIEDTIDDREVDSFINKSVNMEAMTGRDKSGFLEAVFRKFEKDL